MAPQPTISIEKWRLDFAVPRLLIASVAAIRAWEQLLPELPVRDAIENAEFNEFLALRGAVASALGIPSRDLYGNLESIDAQLRKIFEIEGEI